MSTRDDLYTRVHSLFQEVWNEQNAAAIHDYLAPDVVEHGLAPLEQIAQGFDDLVAFHRSFLQSFPDAKFTVDDVLVEGDTTVVRFHVDGTHLGDGIGVPATGRKISFTGMGFGRWRDGKMIEIWNSFDQLSLMRQIGVVE